MSVYNRPLFRQMGGPAQPMPQDMAPPPQQLPPEAAMLQQVEQVSAEQGQQLGQAYAEQMMQGIDAAQSTEDLINAFRGNQMPLDARRDELADYVGQGDADQTPESVLAMVQPVIMMTEEGAMNSGIGNLMQQLTGDIDMMTEAGQPTDMGQGVGSLMMAGAPEAPAPQNFRQGGEVKYLSNGTPKEGNSAAPSGSLKPLLRDPSQQYFLSGLKMLGQGVSTLDEAKSVREYYEEMSPLYKEVLGDTEETKQYNQAQTFFDIAKAGLAFASGRDPETGQLVTNQPLGAQLATAAKDLPSSIQARAAQQREFDLAVNQAALSGAVQRAGEDRKMDRDIALLREQLGTELISSGLKAGSQMLEGKIENLYRISDGKFMGGYNTSIPRMGLLLNAQLQEKDADGNPLYITRTEASAQDVTKPKSYEIVFDDKTVMLGTSKTGQEFTIEGGKVLSLDDLADAQIYEITPKEAREKRTVNRRMDEVNDAFNDFSQGLEVVSEDPDSGEEVLKRTGPKGKITFNTGATIYGRADRIKNMVRIREVLEGDDPDSKYLREKLDLDPNKLHYSLEEIEPMMAGFTKGQRKTRELNVLDAAEMHMRYIDEFGDEQALNVIDASLQALGPIENIQEWFANITGDFFETSEAQMAASQMRQYLRTIAFMGKVAFIANPRIPVAELGPAAALLNDPDRAFFQNAELAASNWNVLNEQLDNLYLNNLSILSERNATKEDIEAAMHSIRQIKMLKNMMGPVTERYNAFRGRGSDDDDVSGYEPKPFTS